MATTKTIAKTYDGNVDGESVNRKSAFAEMTSLSFTFGGGDVFTVNPDELPENIRRIALWHGISQKLGDAAVKPSGTDARAEYEEDPASYARDKVETVWERLTEGTWVERAEGAGVRGSMLAEALHRATGIELAAAVETVKGWSAEVKAQAPLVEEIATALEDIRRERRKAKQQKAGGAPTLASLGLG